VFKQGIVAWHLFRKEERCSKLSSLSASFFLFSQSFFTLFLAREEEENGI
jgi:hypothetical protein